MEFIRSWVRDIAIMVICLGFLELLLPQNSMERLVRVVIGLVIVVIIISPLAGLLRGRGPGRVIREPEGWGWEPGGISQSIKEHYLAMGQGLRRAGYEAISGELERRIAEQVGAVAAMASGNGENEVAVALDSDGNIKEIILHYSGKAPSERVVRSLAGFYGIPENRIRISPKAPNSEGTAKGAG